MWKKCWGFLFCNLQTSPRSQWEARPLTPVGSLLCNETGPVVKCQLTTGLKFNLFEARARWARCEIWGVQAVRDSAAAGSVFPAFRADWDWREAARSVTAVLKMLQRAVSDVREPRFYISIFFFLPILSFRFLGHPKNWETLRMAVVLHLCSNKPASRAQTGSNRVVVWCVRTPKCLLLTSWESAGTFCAITLSYLTKSFMLWIFTGLEALRDGGTFDVVHWNHVDTHKMRRWI